MEKLYAYSVDHLSKSFFIRTLGSPSIFAARHPKMPKRCICCVREWMARLRGLLSAALPVSVPVCVRIPQSMTSWEKDFWLEAENAR